jgi:uncharacterized OsmC-like protein
MRVVLHAMEDLEVSGFAVPGLMVDPRGEGTHFSALEMFATALGLCTYSALASYGEQIAVDGSDISIRLRWRYSQSTPLRIESIDMALRWPGLPASRRAAAERAAAQCTLHNTLAQPPAVTTVMEAAAN